MAKLGFCLIFNGIRAKSKFLILGVVLFDTPGVGDTRGEIFDNQQWKQTVKLLSEKLQEQNLVGIDKVCSWVHTKFVVGLLL